MTWSSCSITSGKNCSRSDINSTCHQGNKVLHLITKKKTKTEMESTSTVKPLTSTGRSAVQMELVIPTRVYSKTKVCAGVKKGDGNQFSWHLPNSSVVQQQRCPPSVPVKVPEQKLMELTAKIMNSQMWQMRQVARCYAAERQGKHQSNEKSC